MKKIPISEATVEQLRVFSAGTLGIEIKASASVEKARAQVLKAWDKPDIPVPESEDESVQAAGTAPEPVTHAQKKPERPMVRLTIGVTEDAGGADPIELGVNGRIMRVPRGEQVEIPFSYFEVLCHAVQDKYDALPDGGMNPVPRKVPLHPFQVTSSDIPIDHLLKAA